MKVGDILRSKKTGKLYTIHKIDSHFVYIGPESMSYISTTDAADLFDIIPKEGDVNAES
jgi:hypothetical protein